jgi:hypothetical protein
MLAPSIADAKGFAAKSVASGASNSLFRAGAASFHIKLRRQIARYLEARVDRGRCRLCPYFHDVSPDLGNPHERGISIASVLRQPACAYLGKLMEAKRISYANRR